MNIIEERASDVALEFADYFDAFVASENKYPDDMIGALSRQLKSGITDISDTIAQIRVAQVLIENVNVDEAVKAYLQISLRLLDKAAEHLKEGNLQDGK